MRGTFDGWQDGYRYAYLAQRAAFSYGATDARIANIWARVALKALKMQRTDDPNLKTWMYAGISGVSVTRRASCRMDGPAIMLEWRQELAVRIMTLESSRVFVERAACLSCGGGDLKELSGGILDAGAVGRCSRSGPLGREPITPHPGTEMVPGDLQ